ncbi:MAG: 23S rRNA (uracil(1939)-C(5))-methyltransferase RlmD [Clostridium sp.]|nr:23S rRNA (uracil(1939)-C(5))-methyltransferase RlmD [Clostridium sp.]
MTDAVRAVPLKTGDEIEIEITALSSGGHGIGRYQGFAVFVPFTWMGDHITAQITKVQKNYAEAKLVDILIPSPERVEPPCHAFGSCGACSLMHASYSAQLEAKRRIVQDAFERIGGISGVTVKPTIGMDTPLCYRNKASFPFGNHNGRVVFGCYEKRSHRLIPLDGCLIQNEKSIIAMKTLCKWANDFGIRAYDPTPTGSMGNGRRRARDASAVSSTNTKKQGILRHGVIRCTEGGTMVIVVTTGKLPHRDELVERLLSAIPDIKSIIHNVNPNDTNLIMGRETRVLFGSDTVIEDLNSLSFAVSAQSFLQVNPKQTIVLYNAAIDALELNMSDSVIDLYCGIGTISLLMAKRVKKVLGIEAVPAAIEDAKRNAVRNKLNNASFICGSVEDVLPKILRHGSVRHGVSAQMTDNGNGIENRAFECGSIKTESPESQGSLPAYDSSEGGICHGSVWHGVSAQMTDNGNGIENRAFECGSIKTESPESEGSLPACDSSEGGTCHEMLGTGKESVACGSIKTESPESEGSLPACDSAEGGTYPGTLGAGKEFTALVLDPPRVGVDKAAIDAIAASGIGRIAYVSCNPATLARDCKLLCAGGYVINSVQPVDMFPETEHVETVVLLSKGEVDSKKIRVEFSLEDMDMSEFQDGATYPQIKEYVLEHTGLKVSNLYISQIKRKCGIEVGKNYNLPKSEDSRQPQCPPEKEKAIREAFKYFGMI